MLELEPLQLLDPSYLFAQGPMKLLDGPGCGGRGADAAGATSFDRVLAGAPHGVSLPLSGAYASFLTARDREASSLQTKTRRLSKKRSLVFSSPLSLR
jgi:hypothetical protein